MIPTAKTEKEDVAGREIHLTHSQVWGRVGHTAIKENSVLLKTKYTCAVQPSNHTLALTPQKQKPVIANTYVRFCHKSKDARSLALYTRIPDALAP